MRFLVSSLIFIAFSASFLRAQDASQPLTEQQVEALIPDLGDSRLAIEIDNRGIEPLLKRSDLQRLRNLGAGPETQGALANFLVASPLTVVSDPPVEGLLVTVADQAVRTDESGQVSFVGLEPGSYVLGMKTPPEYSDIQQRVSLVEGGSVEQIILAPAPARLSINVRDARVTIGSVGSYSGPLRELELPAGTYAVSVARSGHVTFTTSISVGPGEERSLDSDIEARTSTVSGCSSA